MKEDDDPELVLEGRYRANGLIPVEHRPKRIRKDADRDGFVHGDDSDPATSLEPISTDVDENPVEPGLKAIGLAERVG